MVHIAGAAQLEQPNGMRFTRDATIERDDVGLNPADKMAVILGRNAASGASACWGAFGFCLSAMNTLLDRATCF